MLERRIGRGVRLFLSTSLLVVASACGMANPRYAISMREVTRPAAASTQYGEQTVSRVDPHGPDSAARSFAFRDGLVDISWGLYPQRVYFTATNKTPHSIAIVWDRAALVMPDGQSSQVMHNGVRYADCQGPKTPSVIVPNSTLSDVVVPCATVRYEASAWRGGHIFATGPTEINTAWFTGRGETYGKKLTPTLNERDRGRTFRVLLPIEIQGVVNEYTFVFGVDSVYEAKKR